MIKRSYAECTPLFQLINLINATRRDPTDTILEIIAKNHQSYCQLSYMCSILTKGSTCRKN